MGLGIPADDRNEFVTAFGERLTYDEWKKLKTEYDVIVMDVCATARNVTFESKGRNVASDSSGAGFNSPLVRAKALLQRNNILPQKSKKASSQPTTVKKKLVIMLTDRSDWLPERRHVLYSEKRYANATPDEIAESVAKLFLHPGCIDALPDKQKKLVMDRFAEMDKERETPDPKKKSHGILTRSLNDCKEEARTRDPLSYQKFYYNGRIYVTGERPYQDSDETVRDTMKNYTIRSTDIAWKRMWNSGYGKKRAFELIMEGVKHLFKAEIALKKSVLITWHDEMEPVVYPGFAKDYDEDVKDVIESLKKTTFGEADQRVVEAIRPLILKKSLKCHVSTIDTDMVAQLLMLPIPFLDTIMHITLKLEVVSMHKFPYRIPRNYHASDNRDLVDPKRLSSIFFMVSLGSDYNDTFTKCGFPKAELTEKMHEFMRPNCVYETFARLTNKKSTDDSTKTHLCLEIDLQKFFRVINATKRTFIKSRNMFKADDNPSMFVEHISSIFYTMALFAGVCPNHTATDVNIRTSMSERGPILKGKNIGAGPHLDVIYGTIMDMVKECSNVSEILSTPIYKRIRIWERKCTVRTTVAHNRLLQYSRSHPINPPLSSSSSPRLTPKKKKRKKIETIPKDTEQMSATKAGSKRKRNTKSSKDIPTTTSVLSSFKFEKRQKQTSSKQSRKRKSDFIVVSDDDF